MKIDRKIIAAEGINKSLITKILNYNQSGEYGAEITGLETDTTAIHAMCGKINMFKPYGKSSHTKLRLFVKLYDIVPDYSILIYMRQNYNTYSPSGKKYYWRKYREWMNSGNEKANPVKYSLECDWFTDRISSLNAWKEMSAAPYTETRSLNLLSCSTPISKAAKSEFLNMLKNSKRLKKIIT